MNRFTILLALLVCFPASALCQEPEREELQFLIIEALTKNPDVAAATHQMRVAEQRVPQASSLDNPELNFKLMEIPGAQFNQANFAIVELMQMIRFPTKLSTQKDIALIQAEHAHHDHLEKELEIISQLKITVAMVQYARTALELNKENQKLLAQIERVATIQYSVGKASQQDVLKASIEMARLKTEEASLNQDVASAESMLRALLNRPANMPIGPVEQQEPDTSLPILTLLLDYAFKNRPMLVHDSLSFVESGLTLDLMRQEYIPDLKLSLEYVRMPVLQENRWTIMAGISIPFAPWTWSKTSSRTEEATAQQLAKQSTFRNSLLMVEAGIRDAHARVKSFTSQLNAYSKTILPQTEQSLKALVTEYQTGQSSFLMLLDTYRMYQMTRTDAAMIRMKRDQAYALLERSVGVIDLNVIPSDTREE